MKEEETTSFYKKLSRPFRVKRIRRIYRRALGEYTESPFMRLYLSRCDQSMITYTGFNCEAFEMLLQLFRPYFLQYTPYSPDGNIRKVISTNGRKRKISAEVCLGLVLAWTRSRGNLFPLQMDFGLTYSPLCLFLFPPLAAAGGGLRPSFCCSMIGYGVKELLQSKINILNNL